MGIKLLIVDDSRVSRLIIKAKVLLIQPDWTILEASSGAEAIVLATSESPDFITMDINMPGISGYEAVERIRAINSAARIVVLTANIQESSRERASQLKVHFVPKPVTEAAIQDALDYFMGMS